MLNIAVCGANGKMGQEVVKAVNSSDDMKLVAQIDIFNGQFKTIEEAKKATNIDILIEIQNRIHKFRILDDVIAVMLEDKDTEFSDLIESPCQEMCDILNAINDIDKLFSK